MEHIEIINNSNYNEKDDITHELESHKNRNAFNDLYDTIKKFMNSLIPTIDHSTVYNIITENAASEEVTDFLLTVKEEGIKQKSKFIEEWAIDEKIFTKAIKY